MRVLIPILRPDQGFHVTTAVNMGVAYAHLGFNVDFLMCDMDRHYCPVHIYNGDILFDKCGSCPNSVADITQYIHELVQAHNLQQQITLIPLSSLISPKYHLHSYTSINVDEMFDEALRYRDLSHSSLDDINSLDSESFNDFVLPPYYSESFSNERLTFEDLFDYSDFTSSISKTLLLSRLIKNKDYTLRVEHAVKNLLYTTTYDLCILWNGRYAAQKTMLRLARHSNIKVFIHEIGFLNESLSFVQSFSMDEHITVRSLGLDTNWITRRMISTSIQLNLSKSDYFSPKLTASSNAHSYYPSPIIISETKSLHDHVTSDTFCIFLSSPDELSSTYPFDFTEFERNTVLALIPYLSTNVIVRFHPRSVNSLLKSKIYNGVYWRFYLELQELSKLHPFNISIHPPSSTLTSYEILTSRPYASLALFNTMAAELPGFGLTSISHHLSRLAPYASHAIFGLNVESAVSEIMTILPLLIKSPPEIDLMRSLFQSYLSDIGERSLPFGCDSTSSNPFDYWATLASKLI